MSRNHYSYEKRKIEIKKRLKRDKKILKKQESDQSTGNSPDEYLAMIKGEQPDDDKQIDMEEKEAL